MSTKYRDELIRTAQALGLPDDTDLTKVSEQVETLAANYQAAIQGKADADGRLAGVNAAASETASKLSSVTARADAAQDLLAQVVSELESRRDRAGSPQAFADMTAVADIARSGLA